MKFWYMLLHSENLKDYSFISLKGCVCFSLAAELYVVALRQLSKISTYRQRSWLIQRLNNVYQNLKSPKVVLSQVSWSSI